MNDIAYKNINTICNLMESLRNQGLEEIEPLLNLGHNPTIGNMYEGLTKELMNRAIFDQMDLRVVSGKISNSNGVYSNQIDCMIVIGEGKKIPYTDDYVYDINNVLMVIEVKKNLYSNELSDAYANLRSVVNVQNNSFRDLELNMVEDAFRALVRKKCPNIEQIKTLPYAEEMMYHSLVVEALLPLRVVIGYYGFKTEFMLREKYVEFLSKHVSNSKVDLEKGYGITSLPNLIICGNNSIVKTNGMPYALEVDGYDDEYCWLASYRKKPIIILLELLWTRLTYHYELSTTVFGDEVSEEALAPLLMAKLVKDKGWEYRYIPCDEHNLQRIDKSMKGIWEPTVLDNTEFTLMNMLCDNKRIKVGDNDFFKDEEEEKRILKHLKDTCLVYVDENSIIRLLTKACLCAIVPGYGYVAADDYDGRFTAWIKNQMQKLSI